MQEHSVLHRSEPSGRDGLQIHSLGFAANSQAILRGTIRTIDSGFDGGVPGSLLGVEVSAAIKGSAPESLVYILYPVAHFRIGPLYFCNTQQGFEPSPGNQILLFDYTGTVDRDEVLYAPRLDQMLFQGQDGTLFLPSPLKDTPEVETARTLDDVVGLVVPLSWQQMRHHKNS